MAKYNIYGHVLYSEIEYEKLMNVTERIFINALMNKIPGIEQWTDEIWNDIDHTYMLTTLEEIKQEIIKSDYAMLLKYSNTDIDLTNILNVTDKIANMYEINPIEKFKKYEKIFGERVSREYKKKYKQIQDEDVETFLTELIKDYDYINQYIPYKDKNGLAVRWVTPSTYLSMLYNVNITRTGWNQTFKDAEYFENDLLLLETHPRSCPLCAPKQRKSLFHDR